MKPSRAARALSAAAIAAAVVLMLACGIAPKRATVSDGPSAAGSLAAAAQTPVARLGQTITLTGGVGDNQLSATILRVTTHKAAPDNEWVRPAKGVFAAVEVEVKVLKGKTYACQCDFALVAADGSLYEPVWPIGFNSGMQSVTLNSGEKAGGVVVFDVPASAVKGAMVQLRPDWTNDVRGTWQL